MTFVYIHKLNNRGVGEKHVVTYICAYGDASIMQQMNGQTMKMVEMNGKLHMVPVDGSLWLDDVREVSRFDP